MTDSTIVIIILYYISYSCYILVKRGIAGGVFFKHIYLTNLEAYM